MKVNIAGFVVAKTDGQTKTGKPMSRMTIEDYSGKHEFVFYGKNHEKFMSYEQLNTALLVQGTISERWGFGKDKKEDSKKKDPEYEFKPENMMLLGNTAETFLKAFSINISTTMLTPEFRNRLVKTIKRNKGTVPLTMSLFDPVKRWNIEFLSRKFHVTVSSKFIEELEELGVRYSVVKK